MQITCIELAFDLGWSTGEELKESHICKQSNLSHLLSLFKKKKFAHAKSNLLLSNPVSES